MTTDNMPSPSPPAYRSEDRLRDIYRALVVGTRDYVRKNGFGKILVGLSGGIDSALVAAIAYDALGQDSVGLVTIPSRFSSDDTKSDAQQMAENLGIDLLTLPIQGIFDTYLEELSDEFAGKPFDTAEENIQARIRGNLLMALCNKFGWLILTTGNKSELAVGYCTIYGDMCGGLAVISDLPKTRVFEVARWLNRDGEVIPWNTIEKPPSAELRPDQKDEDSLPPYDVLDEILRCLVEEEMTFEKIVERGHARDVVARIENLLYIAEYKRRQAPPGVKITRRNFGRDRRYPITNRYRDAE